MNPEPDDFATRRPLWIALSDLYLDTDPQPFYDTVARVLAASAFASAELEQILREDVHPVLRGNLLTAAGVWDGFDPDWLSACIVSQRRRGRWRRRFGRLSHRLVDRLFGVQPDAIWDELKPRIDALRNGRAEVVKSDRHESA